MNLADRLASMRPMRMGMPCSIHTLIVQLPERDGQALQAALEAPQGAKGRLTAGQLVAAITESGFTVSQSALERHRRRQCRCFSSGNPG